MKSTTTDSAASENLRISFSSSAEIVRCLFDFPTTGVSSLTYHLKMEDLPLLILRTINFQWRPFLLPQRFPRWHPNWFSCSFANRSQVLLPLLLLPRSPMAFLQANCKLLLRDFRLWHLGALLILVLLKQLHRFPWNSSAIFQQRKSPAAAGCVCVCVWNIWPHVKPLSFCFCTINTCRGRQGRCMAVANEAPCYWLG